MTTLPPSEIISSIRTAPRDTVIVVEQNQPLADALHDAGYPVVSVGCKSKAPSVEDGQALADNWSVVTCRSSDAACIGSKPLGRLVETLTQRAVVNGNTSRYRSRGWTENLLANFHALLEPTFGAYADGLHGVPAFVVGAGPSLDEDHPHLKRLGEKGIVIAVNAAARLLEPGGLALTVEGNDVRHKLGELGDGIVRAFSLFANPAVMNHGAGPLLPIFSAELAAVPEWLTGFQRLASSGFGGTVAVSLAERLGCNPIVLVGHDFHMRDGGRIYPECLALGDTRARLDGRIWHYEWDEKLLAQPRQNPIRTEDVLCELDGHTSTHDLANGAQWMGDVARRLSGRTMIQATAGGVALSGWKTQGLAELLTELPDRDWELSPAENGLPAGVLIAWLENQMRATSAAHDAARRLRSHQSRGTIEAMRQALRTATLVEPWCHPTVCAAADERRLEPPSQNAMAEYRAAQEHAALLAEALTAEIPMLMHALIESASVIRAMGGARLENCAFPPGASDDLLRCVLRSMAPYERLPPFRKATEWLTA